MLQRLMCPKVNIFQHMELNSICQSDIRQIHNAQVNETIEVKQNLVYMTMVIEMIMKSVLGIYLVLIKNQTIYEMAGF